MSSALAMFLMAGMVIPGNGPEKVSGEVEQRLDLSGAWEGTIQGYFEHHDKSAVRCVDGQVYVMHPTRNTVLDKYLALDEGRGRVRMKWDSNEWLGDWLGIYRQGSDHVAICIGGDPGNRPTELKPEDGQCLIILHRVKPRK
ncbi:MAG TPA: hypothetical protein VH682_29845 [Gemmataceae bacterium]|jgi:hypothetical protein